MRLIFFCSCFNALIKIPIILKRRKPLRIVNKEKKVLNFELYFQIEKFTTQVFVCSHLSSSWDRLHEKRSNKVLSLANVTEFKWYYACY